MKNQEHASKVNIFRTTKTSCFWRSLTIIQSVIRILKISNIWVSKISIIWMSKISYIRVSRISKSAIVEINIIRLSTVSIISNLKLSNVRVSKMNIIFVSKISEISSVKNQHSIDECLKSISFVSWKSAILEYQNLMLNFDDIDFKRRLMSKMSIIRVPIINNRRVLKIRNFECRV